jgi:hypothetical protein
LSKSFFSPVKQFGEVTPKLIEIGLEQGLKPLLLVYNLLLNLLKRNHLIIISHKLINLHNSDPHMPMILRHTLLTAPSQGIVTIGQANRIDLLFMVPAEIKGLVQMGAGHAFVAARVVGESAIWVEAEFVDVLLVQLADAGFGEGRVVVQGAHALLAAPGLLGLAGPVEAQPEGRSAVSLAELHLFDHLIIIFIISFYMGCSKINMTTSPKIRVMKFRA